MNLLRNGLLMRKTGDRRRTGLTEESASQCGFSAEFITPSRAGACSPYASGWGVGRRFEQSWPLLPSSGSLLAQRWFFSGGWWCRRRSPAPLGAFLTRRWLLPWGGHLPHLEDQAASPRFLEG